MSATYCSGPINDPSFNGAVGAGSLCTFACTIDTRSRQILSGNSNDGQTHTYAYDAVGRDRTNVVNCQFQTNPNNSPVNGTTTSTRSYDFCSAPRP